MGFAFRGLGYPDLSNKKGKVEMTPSITWNNEPPSNRDKKLLEESVIAAIDLPHMRDIRPNVTLISIDCDRFKTGVDAVGYDAHNKPIVAARYSWSVKLGGACYYDDPKKNELLNF